MSKSKQTPLKIQRDSKSAAGLNDSNFSQQNGITISFGAACAAVAKIVNVERQLIGGRTNIRFVLQVK